MSAMVNRNLIRELDTPEEGRQLEELFHEPLPSPQPALVGPGRGLVTGRVLWVTDREVWIDVGAKGPGVVCRWEWEPNALPCPGDAVEVWIESTDEENGTPRLSYRKARFDHQWRKFVGRHKEGDTVSAKVTAQITGGLQVDVGVPAFLPASQVDVRRPPDLAAFVGQTIECKILKIDQPRRTVIVSRRAILEISFGPIRRNLLAEIEPGQVRKGVVKNVAEFGAFVDLGGIDGLLHVTDMAWSRGRHPRDLVRIEETIEVYVLSVDRERERIALSLKHKTPNPWTDLAERFPVGSRQAGEVVTVTSSGAFVKLAPGLEGLVHVSEMSWMQGLANASECVAVGDEIEVQVLSVNPEKQELLLGLREVMPGTEGVPRPELPRVPVEVLDWNNRLVVRIAREIREGRAFDAMPILADALEDAGGVEEAILAHLRDRGPHARRCWVLDLILRQR